MAQINGTDENDVLDGTDADDVIRGFGGDDNLRGGDGNNRLYGHEGNDILNGGTALDALWGGAGDDSLYGSEGSGQLYGGAGNDYLEGGSTFDQLDGGAGDDRLIETAGHDRIDGGDGTDTLSISYISFSQSVTYRFDPEDVRTRYGSTVENVEQIEATGGNGSDRLFGAGGDDLLRGWNGHDRLHGAAGDDFLIGDNGLDTLYGSAGDDYLSGGGDSDTLYGGAGDDTLVGGWIFDVWQADDTLIGGPGADTFLAGPRQTHLSFETSSEAVYVDLVLGRGFGGDAQGDTYEAGISGQVIASRFDDVLVGGLEQDGRDGDDRLVASLQTQKMTGAAGADTFAFEFQNGDFFWPVTIADFSQDEHDLIDLSGVDAKPGLGDQAFMFLGSAAFTGKPGELRFEAVDGNTVLHLQMDRDADIDETITLAGLHTLTAGDFVL